MSLIRINHTNGYRESVALDDECSLSEVRKILTREGIMQESDCFLDANSKVRRTSEARTTLKDILGEDRTIYIGDQVGIQSGVTFEMFSKLGLEEKISYFQNHQINYGIIFTPEGIKRSFQQIYTLQEPPLVSKTIVNTTEESSYAFSETTRNFNLLSSNKTSIAFKSEYINANTEYEQEKTKSGSNSRITEYLLSKLIVSQASFKIDPSKITPNMQFFEDVSNAVYWDGENHQRATLLVEALNQWGFYIAEEFAMGGALYTSDEKQITEFKQAEENKKRFSAAAHSTFSGLSGNSDSSKSTQTDTSSSSKEEFKNMKVSQIGGVPGEISDKGKFASNLETMETWEVVNINKFYPSLMLLANVRVNGRRSTVLRDALKLLDQNYYIKAIKTVQPYLDLLEYATSVEELVNIF